MSSKVTGRRLPRPTLARLVKELTGKNSPSRVVTPRGLGPRGKPAVWKCEEPRYQSLVEEDCARVVDIARCVVAFETHPVKLNLGSKEQPLQYTPDLLLWSADWGAIVEVKSAEKLSSTRTASRLRTVSAALRRHGIPLCVMLDSDVRADGLQETLKLLQRDRPARGRYRADVDAGLWDPHGRATSTTEQLARWRQAQQVCDDLLQRVMRRDPDELLANA